MFLRSRREVGRGGAADSREYFRRDELIGTIVQRVCLDV